MNLKPPQSKGKLVPSIALAGYKGGIVEAMQVTSGLILHRAPNLHKKQVQHFITLCSVNAYEASAKCQRTSRLFTSLVFSIQEHKKYVIYT